MKDEIKEILDIFTKYKDDWYSVEYKLKPKQCVILYDYITNLEQKVDRLLKTQEMYEKKCNKIHNYILQNCEIIRYKDYDEVGKVDGRHILYLLTGGDEE